MDEGGEQMAAEPGGKESIYEYKDEIMTAIRDNKVVVITGNTGCGKTTQIPKMIMANEHRCDILVTQPRRVAAISNAGRVAADVKCAVGSKVGYRIARNKSCSKDTQLTFCTTAVIAQMAINKMSLDFASHIILDEVHERDLETDFLLMLVKDFLQRDPDCETKIILMSATLEAEKFGNYFRTVQPTDVPVIQLNLKRRHKLVISYLQEGIHQATKEETDIPAALYKEAAQRLQQQITAGESTLVFLPGIAEIRQMQSALTASQSTRQYDTVIMHSSISAEHQNTAFTAAASANPKVILSTNIAESSVTIPDVSGVIDFCRTKLIRINQNSGLKALQLQWCSRANSEQRAGRTGRIADGKVWRLVQESFFGKLQAHNDPDIMRVPLESIVLRIKLMDKEPVEFLSSAMDVPPRTNIARAGHVLKELGAIQRIFPDQVSPDQLRNATDATGGALTNVGIVMASLPLPIHLSKLITLGHAFSMLDETVIIAACMEASSVFRNIKKETLNDYSTKMLYADGHACDFTMCLNAFNFWKQHQKTQLEKSWYFERGLDINSLLAISEHVDDIKVRLGKLGLTQEEKCEWKTAEQHLILQFIIAGALYPYYFRSGTFDEGTEKDVCKQARWHDSRSTISMKIKNDNMVKYGELYQEQLKEQMVERGICATTAEIHLEFFTTAETAGSNKLIMRFGGNSNLLDPTADTMASIERNFRSNKVFAPLGEISPSVFKAIKTRQLRQHFCLDVMRNDDDIANKLGLAKELEGGMYERATWNVLAVPEMCILPSKWITSLDGQVSYVLSCEKFYIQPSAAQQRIQKFSEICTDGRFPMVTIGGAQDLEERPVAFTVHNQRWKRTKVMSFDSTSAVCFMVDFGQTVTIDFTELFRLADVEKMKVIFQCPPQCFEARLNSLKPSFSTSPRAVWRLEAVKTFSQWLNTDGKLQVIAHSLVNGIASVELTKGASSINTELINRGYARWQQENFPRVFNELLRAECRSKHPEAGEELPKQEFAMKVDPINDNRIIKQVPMDQRTAQARLDGPFSVLELMRVNRIVQSFPTGGKISERSINSPMLADNPSNLYGRFVAAANVSDKGDAEGAYLEQTSIMPAIAGAGLLVGLTFSPQAVFVRDKTGTRYDCALFGLGGDVKKVPFFGLHDFVLPAIIELDAEDFTIINKLRRLMSLVMKGIDAGSNDGKPAGIEDPSSTKEDIKKTALKLLTKDRALLPPRDPSADVEWPKPGRLANILSSGNSSFAYPPLAAPPFLNKLGGEDASQLRAALKEYLDKIESDAGIVHKATKREYTCPLCDRSFGECSTAENHNASKMHHDRLEWLRKA